MTCDVRIDLTAAGFGTVTIDCVAVPSIAKVEFCAEAGEANRVVLHLIAPRVNITAPAEVERRDLYAVGNQGPETFITVRCANDREAAAVAKILDLSRRGRL